MSLDFSEFHPLDHGIWEPTCWRWAGGIPRHIRYWWDYQFEWPWKPIVSKLRCGQGHHEMVAFWQRVPPIGHPDRERLIDLDRAADGLQCANCGLTRWL